MAVDTKDKRGSCLGSFLPALRTLPDPNTDVDQGDRQHVSFAYQGVLAGAGAGITIMDFERMHRGLARGTGRGAI